MEKLNIEGFVGDPSNPYHQQYLDTCAIKSQQLILQDYGINVTEDQLIELSIQRGWYDGNGTDPLLVGNLIQEAGIPVTRAAGANIYDIAEQLASGHKVIVGVDSNELWEGGILEWLRDLFIGEQANHALIVCGIDNTDPDHPMVLVTDPGSGEIAKAYPLDQFMDAWEDSGCYMVSTDIPTPECMQNFTNAGLSDMHLANVAGVPYNDFLDFQAYSHQIDPMELPRLNELFFRMPSMPSWDFNTALANAGMAPWDSIEFPVQPILCNPFAFDFSDFGLPGIAEPWVDTMSTSHEVDQNALNKLIELRDDAQRMADQCFDSGSMVNGTIFQQQVHDIQSDIDDMLLS